MIRINYQFFEFQGNTAWMWRTFFLIVIAFGLTQCHHDDTEEINLQQTIINTWVLDESEPLMKDGVDVSADYEGLQISFLSNGTYTTSNQGKLFHPDGTWDWADTGEQSLLLDADFSVTVLTLTETKLRIQFSLDTANGNGRTNSVAGEYEIPLKVKS